MRNSKRARRWKIFATSVVVTLLAVAVLGGVFYFVNGGYFGTEARETAGKQESNPWMGESIPDESLQNADADPKPAMTASPAPEGDREAIQETLASASQEDGGENKNISQESTEPGEETREEAGGAEEPTPTPFV